MRAIREIPLTPAGAIVDRLDPAPRPHNWRGAVAHIMPATLSAATIFLSAFLLFQVQPLIGKMILPRFGGVAAVWSAALLFFQLVLLAGYTYAHCSRSCLLPPGDHPRAGTRRSRS